VASLAVVVVSYQGRDLLAACLESVKAQLPASGRLVVVDNGSRDGSPSYVRERHPEALLVERRDNPGFGEAVNEGMRRCSGDWVLVLNNDVTLRPGAIASLLQAAKGRADVGAVAPQMRFARRPQVLNGAGLDVDRLGVAFDRLLGARAGDGGAEPQEVFGASGGAALLRRRMLEDLGGFDGSFFLFLEDVDLAWRARMRGWRALYAPSAVVDHHHSAAARHGSDLKALLDRPQPRPPAGQEHARPPARGPGAGSAGLRRGVLAARPARRAHQRASAGVAGARDWRALPVRRGAGAAARRAGPHPWASWRTRPRSSVALGLGVARQSPRRAFLGAADRAGQLGLRRLHR